MLVYSKPTTLHFHGFVRRLRLAGGYAKDAKNLQGRKNGVARNFKRGVISQAGESMVSEFWFSFCPRLESNSCWSIAVLIAAHLNLSPPMGSN